MRVNDVEGDCNSLLKKLRTSSDLQLVLRRAKCFEVSVSKAEGGGGSGLCVISGQML